MATHNTRELLEQLKSETNTVLDRISQLRGSGELLLNAQPEPGKWSLAQIVEHLNTYNRYYLPVAKIAINKARKANGTSTFSSGWLGNYFTKSMYSEVVSSKKISNKMKAFKGHRPDANLNAQAVIDEFIADEKLLLQLLKDAAHADLASVKIPITLSKWIKISVGDALRFLVAHQVRHLLQINNTFAALAPEQRNSIPVQQNSIPIPA
jgi:hypothetical protein